MVKSTAAAMAGAGVMALLIIGVAEQRHQNEPIVAKPVMCWQEFRSGSPTGMVRHSRRGCIDDMRRGGRCELVECI